MEMKMKKRNFEEEEELTEYWRVEYQLREVLRNP